MIAVVNEKEEHVEEKFEEVRKTDITHITETSGLT